MSAQQHSRSVPANPALWATQGGGLASQDPAGRYVWFELPEGYAHEYQVGQLIPEQWGLAPANQAASLAQERLDRTAASTWDDDGGLFFDPSDDYAPPVRHPYHGWDGT